MIRIESVRSWFPSDLPRLRQDIACLAVVLVYLAVYSSVIVAGHGLPYVTDNNETFSSINHAYNLWNFDFFRSYGLTDEAMSPDPAAHPFVHTHQGNFPRLFSFLLYVLGARSAVSQIWLTTFTVGLFTVLMAYAFFRRLAGRLFAAIAVLVLITDYMLFTQWQVNTYRVWHGFFLFGALNCVHGLALWPRWKWTLATFALYAGLFYWEFVFAAFTAISAGLYTAWTYRNRLSHVLLAWSVQGLSGAVAIGVLATQLLLYLGWHDLLTDVRLTFTARNYASESREFVLELLNFYQTRNIAFFYNLHAGGFSASVMDFLRSLFRYVFQIATPFTALLGIGLAAAAFAGDSRLPDRRDAAVMKPQHVAVATLLLIPGILVFILVLSSDSFVGKRFSPFEGDADLIAVYGALCLLTAIALAVGLRRLAGAISVTGTSPAIGRCARAGLYLFGLGLFIGLQGELYDQQARLLWFDVLTQIPIWMARIGVAAMGLTGAIIILVGRRGVLKEWHGVPVALAPFFISGILAYTFVYKFSTGYLYTGYLSRLSPMPVFHTDAVLALGLFTAVAIVHNVFRLWADRQVLAVRLYGGVAAVFVLAFASCWVAVQMRYVRLVPPNQMDFLRVLESSFHGTGIVSNTYAVPFGVAARTWAYADPEFSKTVKDDGSTVLPSREKQLLWFADRGGNPNYRYPAVFVCFDPLTTLSALITDLRNNPLERHGCSQVITFAKSTNGTVLARDERRDRWAIVRLHYPARERLRD